MSKKTLTGSKNPKTIHKTLGANQPPELRMSESPNPSRHYIRPVSWLSPMSSLERSLRVILNPIERASPTSALLWGVHRVIIALAEDPNDKRPISKTLITIVTGVTAIRHITSLVMALL